MKKNNKINENKEIYECEAEYNDELIKLTIGKLDNDIFIRSSYYGLKVTLDELKPLTKLAFESVDESYNYFKDKFVNKQFRIKNITSNELTLIIHVIDPINSKYKEIEFNLRENFENNEYIFKDLYYKNLQQNKNNNRMKNEINNLNKEIQYLQNEMKNMKNLIQQYQNFCLNNMNNINNNINNHICQINNNMNYMNNNICKLNNNLNNINMNNNNMNNLNYCNMKNTNIDNCNMNNMNNMNTMNIINMYNNNNLDNYGNNSNSSNHNVDNMNRNDSDLYSETQNEKGITVIFKVDKSINPIKINCNENDLISSLIEKFYSKWSCGKSKKRSNKFIFKGKKLNEQMTVKEAGITISDNNVYIVNKFDVIFKLYEGSQIKVKISDDELVSDLIKNFINKSGFDSKDIKSYVFNNCPLYENETVGDTQLEDNSVVFVIVKKKIEKISISLLDREKSIRNTICNIDCPINFKISTLFDKNCFEKAIVFNDKKLEEDITFKEAGITDNSQIYYIPDCTILIRLKNENWNYGTSKSFLVIEISIYDSIFYLKQLYFAKSGGDISRKFFFDSKELDDNLTVKECGLRENSEVIVCE